MVESPPFFIMKTAPILVTGHHRSGSTWVGEVLSSGQTVTYIDEPFAPFYHPGICRARARYWYQYVCAENEEIGNWRTAIANTLQLRYDLLAETLAVRTARDVARLIRDWRRFERGRKRTARVLVKDPLALFSAPWMAQRFDARVVVLLRHPGAFAHSLRRLGWEFDFRNWLEQPLLMRDLLHPWRAEIEAFHSNPGDSLDRAILVWRVIAGVACRWQQEQTDWVFVTHEELARSPVQQFAKLHTTLGLPFGKKEESFVLDHSNADNPVYAPRNQIHATRRASHAVIDSWRRAFSNEEMARLRDGIGDSVNPFYSECSW